MNRSVFFGLIFILLSFTSTDAQTNKYFQTGAPWFEDISQAPLDSQSGQVIDWLSSMGGWGTGKMRIDFSIEVLEADNNTPFKTFTPTQDFFTPDCDQVSVPVPQGGALEGETGYDCTGNGDCHLIVFHTPSRILYEMWRADKVLSQFQGGCLAVWDLKLPYNPLGRGEQCTSADAAGLPIAPLLFTADEVLKGTIDHAMRFILPNDRIRNRTYVRPGTHATGAASGGSLAPPYGTRLRLKASYPVSSLPNQGAQVVARAMQKYGIILADGGNIALTAQSDRFTSAKWASLLGSQDLGAIKITDFEMVDGKKRYPWTGDCERVNPIKNILPEQRLSGSGLFIALCQKAGVLSVAVSPGYTGNLLVICNTEGKIIYAKRAQALQHIRCSQYAAGVYFFFLMKGKSAARRGVLFSIL